MKGRHLVSNHRQSVYRVFFFLIIKINDVGQTYIIFRCEERVENKTFPPLFIEHLQNTNEKSPQS